ncbi:hypothetical protein HW115_03970 [Verrucomicrobiaceae bacterium N1E253]|uniref:DUF642 domain-containing protein n=1 Tax=Oceaniferula marina TaxID=2748318 RepID=A0A851GCT6_9BACT|nr:hypothetical protein [Oceaniferula marina]NWK54752.1 hypothetical protein [Oceaniferula marina]
MKKSLPIEGVVIALLYGQVLTAGTIPLINASFESTPSHAMNHATSPPGPFNENHYNRSSVIEGWTVFRPLGDWDAALITQAYADTEPVQIGPLHGKQACWLSNKGGAVSQLSDKHFSAMGPGTYTFTVALAQSSNFTIPDRIALEIIDGSGRVMGTPLLIEDGLTPGQKLKDFTVSYQATGKESGRVGVRVVSRTQGTNGVYVLDHARLQFVASEGTSGHGRPFAPVISIGGVTVMMSAP